MKKTLIILITFTLTQFTYGQTMDELMKMWNSETVRIGDQTKSDIDSMVINIKSDEKSLISSHYTNGTLKVYRQSESISKMVKTYKHNDTAFTENYYFDGQWPVYVEITHTMRKLPEKFYFDKTNLMLCIDSKSDELTIENEKCSDWWLKLLENMEKLKFIANSDQKQINEDEVKLPDPIPMTKEDSLKMVQLKVQFDELTKTLPDSLKK